MLMDGDGVKKPAESEMVDRLWRTDPRDGLRPMQEIRGKGQTLYRKAKTLIPGGTQLLSKRPELFLPEIWPAYYSVTDGVYVLDLEGNEYIDMSLMGVGACVLGYSDRHVDAEAMLAIMNGVMCTLNVPEEVELAELLIRLHPWADMVRYARTGGEAMAMAVRIARAHTGRDTVAFCGYHGWTDWYVSADLPDIPATGTPAGLKGTALPFRYNRIDELYAIARDNKLAAIVMEPQRGQEPIDCFLDKVRDVADSYGAVLIFDEITTGFRMTTGGIHLLHNVNPDIAVFAKAMANGYAMAAVIGTEEVMQSAQVAFISSTNWTERIGPAAALATIRKHERLDVASHLIKIGNQVKQGWESAVLDTGLPIRTYGLPSLCHFDFNRSNALEMITLFTQLMLERGYLAYNQFKPSYAHKPHHIENYLVAVREVFQEIANGAELKGPVAKSGFYRLT